jgi:hypothetical protein
MRQIVSESLTKDIAARRKELAELDRDWSKTFERAGEPLAGPSLASLPSGEEPQDPGCQSEI